MNAVVVYIQTFVKLARGKLTTWIALTSAAASELLSQWDSAASLFPHWLVQQKPHIISFAALTVVWSRVRRELKALLENPPQ